MTDIGSLKVKTGLAEMLKGGVIMDVTTPEQAINSRRSWSLCRNGLRTCPFGYPR